MKFVISVADLDTGVLVLQWVEDRYATEEEAIADLNTKHGFRHHEGEPLPLEWAIEDATGREQICTLAHDE